MTNTNRPTAEIVIGSRKFTAYSYAVGREALRVQEATDGARKEGKSDVIAGSEGTKAAFGALQVACDDPEAAGKVGGDLYEWVMDTLSVPDTAQLITFVTDRVSGKN